MATLSMAESFVSVEEYLSTGYDPDREYDEGAVLERNMGEIEHSFLQTILAALFTNNMEAWGIFALTEQRVQIAPRKFRVPDVCVLRMGSPWQKILTVPPWIAIEILSPEDRLRRVEKKALEYLEFGIENVWIIDPQERLAYHCATTGLKIVPDGVFEVPGTQVRLVVPELFEKLEKTRNFEN